MSGVTRWAYIHKRKPWKFGILEAVNYQDALNWLGSSYRIKKTTVDYRVVVKLGFDRDLRWLLVCQAMPKRALESLLWHCERHGIAEDPTHEPWVA